MKPRLIRSEFDGQPAGGMGVVRRDGMVFWGQLESKVPDWLEGLSIEPESLAAKSGALQRARTELDLTAQATIDEVAQEIASISAEHRNYMLELRHMAAELAELEEEVPRRAIEKKIGQLKRQLDERVVYSEREKFEKRLETAVYPIRELMQRHVAAEKPAVIRRRTQLDERAQQRIADKQADSKELPGIVGKLRQLEALDAFSQIPWK